LFLCCLTISLHTFSLLFGTWISIGFIQTIPFYWFYLHYVTAAIIGTFTHWAGHHHWSGRWFRAHTIEHHTKLYPTKRFLNDKTLVANDGNSKYYIPTMLFPFISTYLVFHDVRSSLATGIWILCWMEIVDLLHDAYHMKGHWLEKYWAFQVLREVHFKHHHGDMFHNYGIFDFFVDLSMGNFALTTS